MRSGAADEENLWSKILDDVQSRSSNAMPQASMLILGDNDSGKTTLVARLQRVDDPKKGSGLEYHFLEVNPDLKDGLFAYQLGSALPDVVPGESARLGVWVLDGDPHYAPLVNFALTPENLDRCLVVLCAQMAEPGALMDSLHRWAGLLERHFVQSTATSHDKGVLGDCRERQIRFWQEYVEPLDSSSHSETGAKVPSMESDHILLPLGDFVLTSNTGLPLVVVITKCDSMPTLEKEYDFKDEHFDFMQQHVRKFCLQYGAALVYTSVKDSRNVDVLYKYLLHRLYGFPFTQPASVVERDAIFIPAGWDNEKKISILYENMTSLKPEDAYNDHIKKPLLKRPIQRDVEIQAENEQNFLARQLNILNSQTTPQPAGQAAGHNRPDTPSTPNSQQKLKANSSAVLTPQTPMTAGSPNLTVGKKSDSAKTTPMSAGSSQEGVLAQFFNNLLNKKGAGTSPGGVPSPGTPGSLQPSVGASGGSKPTDKTTFSNEAAASEFNRMLNERTNSPDEKIQNFNQSNLNPTEIQETATSTPS